MLHGLHTTLVSWISFFESKDRQFVFLPILNGMHKVHHYLCLNILTLIDLDKIQTGCFIEKSIHRMLPHPFDEYFT
jgi:hypothetical protein